MRVLKDELPLLSCGRDGVSSELSPYSPDLAHSDFHLSGGLKVLSGERFVSDGEITEAVQKWLRV